MSKPATFAEKYHDYEVIDDPKNGPYIPFEFGKIYQPGRVVDGQFEPSNGGQLELTISNRDDNADCKAMRHALAWEGRRISCDDGSMRAMTFHRNNFNRIAGIVKPQKRSVAV